MHHLRLIPGLSLSTATKCMKALPNSTYLTLTRTVTANLAVTVDHICNRNTNRNTNRNSNPNPNPNLKTNPNPNLNLNINFNRKYNPNLYANLS